MKVQLLYPAHRYVLLSFIIGAALLKMLPDKWYALQPDQGGRVYHP